MSLFFFLLKPRLVLFVYTKFLYTESIVEKEHKNTNHKKKEK